jgi:septation ring formation regulator EzrA
MELNIEGLTQEQIEAVQKIIQSETDKVRTKYSSELKTVNDELAQYKPKQKSDSELALEQRIANLEAKEKEVANKERAMTIADKLKAKGLPGELAQYLNVGEDIDGSIDKVGDALGNYFLGQVSNPSGNHTTNKGITKADFAKMSYSERAKLFQENNELYKALSK